MRQTLMLGSLCRDAGWRSRRWRCHARAADGELEASIRGVAHLTMRLTVATRRCAAWLLVLGWDTINRCHGVAKLKVSNSQILTRC